MQRTNNEPPSTYAGVFHSMAGSFLAAQEFTLTGDLASGGMHGSSSARYRSKRRLSLWVVFDPNDSGSAEVSCGREWTPKGWATLLSNRYSMLAKRFGLDVPLTYPFAIGEKPSFVAERILADLKRSLPTVVSKVSLDDLVAIENEEPTGLP